MPPEWAISLIIGVLGLMAGVFIPNIAKALKLRRQEGRLDNEQTFASYKNLLADIRHERAEMAADLEVMRDEHTKCLEVAAQQAERIRNLEEKLSGQQKQIERLQSQLEAIR